MEWWVVTATNLFATRRSTFRLNVKSAICSFVVCIAQLTTTTAVTVKFKCLKAKISQKWRRQKVREKFVEIVNFKGKRKMKNVNKME